MPSPAAAPPPDTVRDLRSVRRAGRLEPALLRRRAARAASTCTIPPRGFLSSASSRNRAGRRPAGMAARQRRPRSRHRARDRPDPGRGRRRPPDRTVRQRRGRQAARGAARRRNPRSLTSAAGGGRGCSTSTSSVGDDAAEQRLPAPEGLCRRARDPPGRRDRSAANAAEKADRAKRATAVGLISQADFTVTPKPAAGDYVVYSGAVQVAGPGRAGPGQAEARVPGGGGDRGGLGQRRREPARQGAEHDLVRDLRTRSSG